MAKPTMQDVAELAGVSRSLVSLVLQDAPNVSAVRRSAVLDAAEQLGYRPNSLARNLARGRSMTIGIVIDDLHPFFALAVEGVEERLDAAGYQALIANGARDIERTVDALSTFSSLQVDGAIAVGPRGEVSALLQATPNIPLVLVSFEAPADGVDTVCNDETMGCALAVEHLVSLGHERIVHVSGGAGASAAARTAAYCLAMTRLGLESNIDVIESDFTYEAGQKAAVEIANHADRPSAVFAANDLNALGMIAEFNRVGIEVPSDLSIVGYDDSGHTNGFGDQGLTTVHQPVYQFGVRAAELLLERLTGDRSEAVHDILTPTLALRTSTARAAALR